MAVAAIRGQVASQIGDLIWDSPSTDERQCQVPHHPR